MRKLALLIVGMALAGMLAVPGSAHAWTSVGLGIGYGGPYAYPYAYPYAPPAYYPPPACYWPGYGPEIAVRWNRYFDPRYPRIQGYTLPR